MKGFTDQIQKLTLANSNFRHVLYTSKHIQLVLMCLQPSQDIGQEIHQDNDQFFRFEQGQGKCIIDDHEYLVTDGSAVIVPAGATHNIINTSSTDNLKFYTLYSPPHHQDGIIRATKEEALQSESEFDGRTSE